jgi:hypothetical protein
MVHGQEGSNSMSSNTQAASGGLPSGTYTELRSSADLIYQAITVVAALLLLGSLWSF